MTAHRRHVQEVRRALHRRRLAGRGRFTKFYRPTPNADAAKVYNKTLAELRDIAKQVAAEQKASPSPTSTAP